MTAAPTSTHIPLSLRRARLGRTLNRRLVMLARHPAPSLWTIEAAARKSAKSLLQGGGLSVYLVMASLYCNAWFE